jgi:hypothetical protein
MACIFDNQADVVVPRELDAGLNIGSTRHIEHIAGQITQLAGCGRRPEWIARIVLPVIIEDIGWCSDTARLMLVSVCPVVGVGGN